MLRHVRYHKEERRTVRKSHEKHATKPSINTTGKLLNSVGQKPTQNT